MAHVRFATQHRSARDMQHVDMLSRIPEGTQGCGRDAHCDGSDDARDTRGASSDYGEHSDGRGRTEIGTQTGNTGETDTPLRTGDVWEDTTATLTAGASVDGAGLPADETVYSVNALASQEVIWYQKHDRTCRALVHRLKHPK